ncbi:MULTISPECIES: drug/metabolite exporter YedA [unclassified Meiothermus]|uniref:drug/metabolite exporter YedA n=1 Tax=unclassified Meiothermus TaxID=370471 RepID=UPI000D7C57B9|nr:MULTISPECIES: drug/metabolite exporter YedA [unclassified Meiothermus]PZA08558.1 drug/metabolite exporter YedA [Meiothermus sp. Pnk-1]RYM40824.1 drug/metabolite exporter YedA [Meiothermus sp. PNK-Is4]
MQTHQVLPRTAGDRGLVLAALLALYLIWGSTYLAIVYMVETMPALLATGVRFLVAGGGMFLVLRLRGAPAPTRREWWGAAWVGTLLMGGGMGMVALGESLGVASGLAATIIATMPLWLALFGRLWGEKTRGLEWLGMALGFAGVALLMLEGNLRSNLLGTLLIFLAPVCWAFGSAWSRHMTLPKGMMGSAAEMLVGGGVLVVMGTLLGERFTQLPSLSSLAAWAYLVVFGSVVGYSAYMFLLSRVRPALAGSYAYVNPVVAVLLGVALAAEPITLVTLVALPVILLGVGLVAVARR